MKHSFLTFLSLLMVGCAHFEESAPKTVQFPYANDLLQKVQMTARRSPASLSMDQLSEKSPRRVYFSALYHQYITLGHHLRNAKGLQSCPQFHHDKIETDAGVFPTVTIQRSSSIETAGKDFFPELAFNKSFSLRDYHQVIKTELDTLCEEGVSDNFYKFDNLITHYAHKPSFHQDPKAMGSVLKIPVFANFYLVKMLEAPGVNVTSPEEKRFIQLTRTHWFESYVTEANKLRNTFIKNKFVRR